MVYIILESCQNMAVNSATLQTRNWEPLMKQRQYFAFIHYTVNQMNISYSKLHSLSYKRNHGKAS